MNTRTACCVSLLLFAGCVSADDEPTLAQEDLPIRDYSVAAPGDLLGVVKVTGSRTCTGALISSNTVLTSAQCLWGAPTAQIEFRNEPSTGLPASPPLMGRVRAHPNHIFTIANNHAYDLATVTLDASAPGYAWPFTVSNSFASAGSPLVIAGYGGSGVGCVDRASSFPALHDRSAPFDRYVAYPATPTTELVQEGPTMMQWDTQVFCDEDEGGPALLGDGTSDPTVLAGVLAGWDGWIYGDNDLATPTGHFYPWIESAVCTWSAQNRCSTGAIGDLCECTARSNILWRNQTTGDVAIWTMDDGRATSYPTVQQGISRDWQIVGSGDFDGDRQADILWRYKQKLVSSTAIWRMVGTTHVSDSYPRDPGRTWNVAAVADFDGNGRSDILWRDGGTGELRLWKNGDPSTATKVSYANTGINVSPLLVVRGAGDFDGDRKADIFWENTADGNTAIWMMDGSTWLREESFGLKGEGNVFQGVGDFNGDARADVLWRDTRGFLQIWFNGGGVRDARDEVFTNKMLGPSWNNEYVNVGGTARPSPASTSWTIDRIADFNHDGRDDLLWRSGSAMTIWYLDGTRFITEGDPRLPTDTGPHWFDPAWQTSGISRQPGF